MSLYAIGDLHLHFQSEVKSKSQRRERIWKKHEEKFLKNCRQQLTDDDTLVLVGDHSWGRKLAECEEDLSFIASLPGRKILLRGNHDQFWDAKKTDRLNELYQPALTFLQNSFEVYDDYAIVGTKGFTFEGPFYLDQRGRIFDWDRTEEAHSWKLIERELQRLEESFEKAKAAGYKKYIMFLHYPPTNIMEQESGFTEMARQYGAEKVIYAHSHGESRFHDSLLGDVDGIEYLLVSGDYLRWMPKKILD